MDGAASVGVYFADVSWDLGFVFFIHGLTDG